jgi:hypothetical protein
MFHFRYFPDLKPQVQNTEEFRNKSSNLQSLRCSLLNQDLWSVKRRRGELRPVTLISTSDSLLTRRIFSGFKSLNLEVRKKVKKPTCVQHFGYAYRR